MTNNDMPDVIYAAKFTGNTEHHYDVKEEQAYVADRRTPLEAPYRNKENFKPYYSQAHIDELNAKHKEELKAQREALLNKLWSETYIHRNEEGWQTRLSKLIDKLRNAGDV